MPEINKHGVAVVPYEELRAAPPVPAIPSYAPSPPSYDTVLIPRTEENRQFVIAELAKGTPHEAIADALVRSLAVQYVEGVARHEEGNRIAQYRPEERYRFLPPPPPVTQAEIDRGVPDHIAPVEVRESNFQAFCEAHGLDPVEMLKVWNGEKYEHKLWRQVRTGAFNFNAIQHSKNLNEFMREEIEREQKAEKASQKRRKAEVSNAPRVREQPKEWTP